MDFEKAYKRKALEPIVSYIESVMASYSKEELEARIKKALPEKESEDERIRKMLISLVKHHADTLERQYEEDMLAYLEKQKEQKPSTPQDIAAAYQMGLAAGRKEQKPLSTEETELNSIAFLEQLGYTCIPPGAEQKPAEWSEEYHEEDLRTRFAFYTYKDEDDALYLSNVFVEEASRHKGFGTKILKAAEKVAETIGASRIFLKVKQNTPANDWYRRHGYGYETFEDDYDWLEKRLEYLKPNQEWSEEDEKMFGRLKEILNIADAELCKKLNGEAILIGEGEFNHLKFGIAHCLSWLELRLKSIRPQPHWKPSEEQMETLLWCTAHLGGADHRVLAELYEHLKMYCS